MTLRVTLKGMACLTAVSFVLACGDSSSGGSGDVRVRSRGVVASRSHEAGIVRLRWVPVGDATGYVAHLSCGKDGEILDQILLSPSGCNQLLADGFNAGLCESDVTIAPFQQSCSNIRVGISAMSAAGESVNTYPLMTESE